MDWDNGQGVLLLPAGAGRQTFRRDRLGFMWLVTLSCEISGQNGSFFRQGGRVRFGGDQQGEQGKNDDGGDHGDGGIGG
jgi:hypothetical protein